MAIVYALGEHTVKAETVRLVTSDETVNRATGDEPSINSEILRQVFAAMGWDVSIEPLPVNRLWMMILRGERDGMFSTPPTSDRGRICAFPEEPLNHSRQIFFVRTADIGKLQFSTFDDLSGHNVAVLEAVPGLREQPAMVAPELVKFLRAHHNMIEVPNPTAAFRMLAAGHVDYAAADLPYGTYVIAKMGLTGKFQPLQSRSVNEVGLYVCFSKARFSPSFVETFSRTLGEFKKTEAYDLICRKYFTQKCTP